MPIESEVNPPKNILKNTLMYNYGCNILRIYDILPNFPFTTSEAKPDYF